MHYIDENEVKIAEAGALELLLTMVVSFKLSLPDGLGWAAALHCVDLQQHRPIAHL